MEILSAEVDGDMVVVTYTTDGKDSHVAKFTGNDTIASVTARILERLAKHSKVQKLADDIMAAKVDIEAYMWWVISLGNFSTVGGPK